MKNTKKALLLSVMGLLLCVSMLVGTTFAWFTDSVSTGKNTIAAGNLDVVLQYKLKAADAWAEVTSETELFDDAALWEPGYTQVVYLKVSNAGSLALKYQLGVNIVSETQGKNVDGDMFKLSDYIEFDTIETEEEKFFSDRDAAREAVTDSQIISKGYSKASVLEKTGDAEYVALVVYMPEETGNVANYRDIQPEITLGLELFATQLASETDSFGPDYDAGAPWTGDVDTHWYFEDPDAQVFTVDTAEELAGFATLVNGTATAPVTTFAAEATTTCQESFKGKTVKLGANVDLRDVAWTPIGRIGASSTDFTYAFKGTFDGGNYTVSNLNVSNTGWAGLFGIAYQATIKNLKLDGVTINSNRMAGTVVGQLYGSIDNCHVSKANITVVPNAVGDSYDNGDKVGGIVGWIGDNGNNRTLTGCFVTDAQISAYRDVGGIAGYIATSTTVTGNTVTGDTDITADQTTNFYGEKDANAGEIVGRRASENVTVENNTIGAEVSVQATYVKNGLIFRAGTAYEGVTLYKVPSDYKSTTVTVPEGITSIGGYAFAYNDNIEKIVLPNTVTTLEDRAFRDTSASTVVLNEGLTNISYQAFRNAANVTSVEIPSTVTTISKEAFQNSGVKTLTVPATVTTIEYGAMRDMFELESVTIEGNADIPVYAFRACAKLRTVILNGDDVTFGGGSRGMIFTNKENGDGSAITVIVKNETVKDRLLAADTAARDYGGYTIVVGDKTVSNAAELKEAIDGGATTICLANGDDYDLKGIQKSGLTLIGQGNNVKIANTTNYAGNGALGAIWQAINLRNVTITSTVYTMEGGGEATFTNVTFAAGFRNGYGSGVVFEGCSFGSNSEGYALHFQSDANSEGGVIKLNGCEFEGGKVHLGGKRSYEFTGCDFAANTDFQVWSNITLDGCTVDGVAVTAGNISTLFPKLDLTKVTVK